MRRLAVILLAVAALAMVGLAAGGLVLAIAAQGGAKWLAFAVVGLAALGLLFLWQVWSLLRHHVATLERLKGAVLNVAGNSSARLPRFRAGEATPEIHGLHAALTALEARHAEERAAPDERLQAVLASLPDAMLVITEDGQVSLVNHVAKALLGAQRVAVGTSVYAALSRTTVKAALARAREAGGPVDAMIGTLEGHQLTAKVAVLAAHGGAVITIPAEEVEFRAGLEADLALHDQPPAIESFDHDTPLEHLPVLVLDTETTGLEVSRDRVIAIGGLRLVGGRMYRATSFDHLVNPGTPIPPRSTAIHGITDPMVADAPPFAEVYATLRNAMKETVVVGHQIAFDLAMLRAECDRHRCAWEEPQSLDTLLLVATLVPGLVGASLDVVADELGVSIHGRHTALGDSLVTAEVFASLLPRLADRGITTFGEAVAFSRQAKYLIRAQAKAGW